MKINKDLSNKKILVGKIRKNTKEETKTNLEERIVKDGED